jgi:predicted DNA-binding WGR domain protein
MQSEAVGAAIDTRIDYTYSDSNNDGNSDGDSDGDSGAQADERESKGSREEPCNGEISGFTYLEYCGVDVTTVAKEIADSQALSKLIFGGNKVNSSGSEMKPATPEVGVTEANIGSKSLGAGGGGSDKFWSIRLDGHDSITLFGRRGTHGTKAVKTHTSEARAQAYASDLIQSKIRKGYSAATAPAALASGWLDAEAAATPKLPRGHASTHADCGWANEGYDEQEERVELSAVMSGWDGNAGTAAAAASDPNPGAAVAANAEAFSDAHFHPATLSGGAGISQGMGSGARSSGSSAHLADGNSALPAPEDWITVVVRGCITAGWATIKSEETRTGAFEQAFELPLVRLTALGKEVLAGRVSPAMLLPDAPSSASCSKAVSKPKKTAVKCTMVDADVDDALVDRLKEWRAKTSKAEGQNQVWLVLTNKVIDALSAAQPRSIDELLQVHGIGNAKAEKYGESILSLVAEHRATE